MKKILIIILIAAIIIILVAGGYYGYRWYQAWQLNKELPVITPIVNYSLAESLGAQLFKSIQNPIEKGGLYQTNPFKAKVNPFSADNVVISNQTQTAPSEVVYPVKELDNCKNQANCRIYCNEATNMEVCLGFAEKNNLAPANEIAEVKKVLQALESGVHLPGGCKERIQCEDYCSETSHIEECFSTALEGHYEVTDDVEIAKKEIFFMARGETPGGCNSKEACEAYCSDENHNNECIDFALKVGLMTTEEAAIAKKTGGKGPGGCRSEQECGIFCNSQANQKTCFDFAKDYGLISEEELQKILQDTERLKSGLKQATPEVIACLKQKFGEDIVEKIESGEFVPGYQGGESIGQCFAQYMPQVPQGGGTPESGIPSSGGAAGHQIPSEALGCMKQIYGEEIVNKMLSGEMAVPSDIQSIISSCMMQQTGPQGPTGQ